MAKLSQIIEPFANALGLPARSMNVLAMMLRKRGLITKGGRGPAGAEMGSSDATNLLLAAMVGGEATSADKSVTFVRAAGRQAPGINDGTVPPVSFLREALGDTLDALIDAMIDGDACNTETGYPITNMTLTVDQPSDFGCSAELWIDDGTTSGTVRFHRYGEAFGEADFFSLSDEQKSAFLAKLHRPRMHISASIGLDELFEIAEIIGGPFPEEAE
jgi:hypothetical protein